MTNELMHPEKEEARRFLNMLDPTTDKFTFLVFDDNQDRKDRSLTEELHGTLEEHWTRFKRDNLAGCGIFVAANQTDLTGRRNDNIIKPRAIWQEDDDGFGENSLPLVPQMVVESSPGKYHRYLLTHNADSQSWKSVQQVMVDRHGSDPNAKDLARVMRLPGFYHQKVNEKKGLTGTPHLVKIVHLNPALPYDWTELVANFPPTTSTVRKRVNGRDALEGVLNDAQVKDLKSALPYLQAHSETEQKWSAIMHHLRPHGEQGFELFCFFSWLSKKHDMSVQELREKWNDYDPQKIKSDYRSIFTKAKKAGWQNPKSGMAELRPDKPEPLVNHMAALPYPIDTLPAGIGDAIKEVQGYTQAPTAIVACSALSALSLASQALYDVARDSKLISPVGLFFMVVAESGERKTTCDNNFTKPIAEWEKFQRHVMQWEVQEYKSQLAGWQTKIDGVKSAIKAASKSGKDTGELLEKLQALHFNEPKKPMIPRLIYTDTTPEALQNGMKNQWPSAGILSSEGGTVLGSHGMSAESSLRTLSSFNTMWDGGDIRVERATKESFVLSNPRLTVGLALQPAALNNFIEKNGDLARGSGFFARFLVTCPETTQGSRLYSPPPKHTPMLVKFNSRLTAILNTDPRMDDDGTLVMGQLPLSLEAHEIWVENYNRIERELTPAGLYQDIRDVASKMADNAARLSALFQIYEGVDKSSRAGVSADCMLQAWGVIDWHLSEALRFFGEIAMPENTRSAIKLDEWLLRQAKNAGVDRIPRREVQRVITPARLREGDKLKAALRELSEHGRAWEVKEGRQKLIVIHPDLLT